MTRRSGIRAWITCLAAALICWTGAAVAQGGDDPSLPAAQDAPQPAILVADDVFLSGNEQLVASGNVEALYDGRRLKASEIVYDRTTETLRVTGPISLEEADGTMLVLADSAELDREMRNGLMTGARIVMDDQVQLAANELARVNGRYNQLYKAAVTSCRVCNSQSPPLWQLRARRVVHDQQEKQLYFDDAQFRVLGTPVFYLPRLRLPDPTLERATGFLVPSLNNSSLLGFGARVPYFIRIGDHKDLTVTPYLSTESRTLELRYRQAFRNGTIEVTGALSDDDIGGRSFKSYVFANSTFALPRDFTLRFDIEAVNDDTYLLDYGYSEKDRLDSEISVERARRDEYIRVALTNFRSLRAGESNSTLPTIVSNGEYERRFQLGYAPGGEIRLGVLSHAHYRSSNLAVDGADFDPFADGRDVARFTVSADWHRSWTIGAGVLTSAQVGLAIDSFHVQQAGITSRSEAVEVTPSASVELRWPLLKTSSAGATHVIEPVMQLSWVGGSNPLVPNDESTRIEFDEGNLFATSRFTAPDRRERGFNSAYGISWTRYGSKGWQSSFAVGQVVRDEAEVDPAGGFAFTNSSGLQDRYSDLLIAGQFKTDDGLAITARGLFDDDFVTTKAEARASWRNDRATVGGTYIWLRNDPAEARPDNISEWAFDASYRLSRHWTGSADWRYDVASDESVRAGLGVTYTNECVDISLSASRRFTSSTILVPSTDISFTVGLRGFTTKTRDKSYVRTCEQ
ncbi:LPS-assembly protein LptD precursor [Roseovarius sp. THAF9]|uniref:LPS-assembly protein LptD n=1 Tax=Roseovarius sp. THAF9 TaxID=2587847 RepID=UPI001269735F|nr:LPS assembly protein LptD [Roseovarius sp. THAF9]QFT93267.1 LPS-assembly protein LptD precursor [Roseovarius sp. THAF9]